MSVSFFLLPGGQLLYNYPAIFDYSMPLSFKTKYTRMAAAVAKEHVKTPPWKQEVTLKSLAGVSFISFAKFSNFNAGIVSGQLKFW